MTSSQGFQGRCVFAVFLVFCAPLTVSALNERERAERIGNAAAAAATAQRYDQAVSLGKQALDLHRRSGDQASEGELLLFLGTVEKLRGNADAAREHIRDGLAVYDRIEHRGGQTNAHLLLFQLYREAKDWSKASAEGESAIELLRVEGTQRRILDVLLVLGEIDLAQGQYAQAAERLEEAATLSEGIGEYKLGEIRGLLGTAYMAQGRRREALPLLQEDLRRAERSGDTVHLATALSRLGSTLRAIGEVDAALEHLRRAEALFRGLRDSIGLSEAQANLAYLYSTKGRYTEALALYEEVISEARTRGDADTLALALNSSSAIFRRLGRIDEALRRSDEALVLRRRSGHAAGEAIVLNNRISLDLAAGRLEDALIHSDEALRLRRKAGDRTGEAITLSNSAHILIELGRLEEAVERFEQALALARTSGERSVEADVLREMSQLLAVIHSGSALPRIDEAIRIVRAAGDRPGEVKALKIRGSLLFALGRIHQARRTFDAVLAASRELGDRNEEAEALAMRGVTLLRIGRPGAAKASLRQALAIQEEIGSSGLGSATLLGQGDALWALGRQKRAIRFYRRAVRETESQMEEIRTDDLLSGFLGNRDSPYIRLIQVLLLSGEMDEAFGVAERARGRTFLRQVSRNRREILSVADPVLAEQEATLRERLSALGRQLRGEQVKTAGRQDRALMNRLSGEIDQARREYGALRIRLRQSSPESSSLLFPSPLVLKDVQTQLEGGVTLISYFSLQQETLAWVVDRTSAHLVRLPVKDSELAQQIEILRGRIADRQDSAEVLTRLHGELIAPLERHIRHRRLLIIPHRSLHLLPFAALSPDGGKTFLIEKYAVSFLPSASALPFLGEKRSLDGGRALILGNPDGSLPQAAAEARSVASLFGAQAHLGAQATEAALMEEGRPIDYLHLAAHATLEPARPLFSRIELTPGGGQDGNLEVHEIFGLDLRGTNLVVLSGCDTGRGARSEGDDIIGLSRAFLYAGAPAVVTTLWAIDDEASRLLMEGFYRRLRAGGTPAVALQAAQKDLLTRQGFRSPWFWAAFQLTGEGGGTLP